MLVFFIILRNSASLTSPSPSLSASSIISWVCVGWMCDRANLVWERETACYRVILTASLWWWLYTWPTEYIPQFEETPGIILWPYYRANSKMCSVIQMNLIQSKQSLYRQRVTLILISGWDISGTSYISFSSALKAPVRVALGFCSNQQFYL